MGGACGPFEETSLKIFTMTILEVAVRGGGNVREEYIKSCLGSYDNLFLNSKTQEKKDFPLTHSFFFYSCFFVWD